MEKEKSKLKRLKVRLNFEISYNDYIQFMQIMLDKGFSTKKDTFIYLIDEVKKYIKK